MSSSSATAAPRAWIVEAAEGVAEARIWGLTPAERLERALRNAGCTQIDRVPPGKPVDAASAEKALLVRGDLVFGARLIDGLVSTPDVALFAPLDESADDTVPVAVHAGAGDLTAALALLRGPDAAAEIPPSLRRVDPDELAPAYIASLRKAEPATVLRARPEALAAIERRLFGAAYKTVTDLVTRWLWPIPAAALTRVLARRRVHPNTITVASWVLAIAAALLFAKGSFGLGLLAAWGMTFLDTVDGKLARVTLTSSRFGHVLDHSLDLIHPPFWYWAWGVGVVGHVDAATAVVIAGYLAGRALEGVFLLVFGMETHCWRPIDNLFRTITARRNPNLILLTVGAVGAAPGLGREIVAIWTVISIGFHGIRLLQALVARSRGVVIRAWDEAPAPATRPIPEAANASEEIQ
jgi:phosphatidylglycerophosphate synthase